MRSIAGRRKRLHQRDCRGKTQLKENDMKVLKSDNDCDFYNNENRIVLLSVCPYSARDDDSRGGDVWGVGVQFRVIEWIQVDSVQ